MKTMGADKILAIDAVRELCKNSLKKPALIVSKHLQLADIGLQKCSSPVTQDNIDTVYNKAKAILNDQN
jgi:hypothetical protein